MKKGFFLYALGVFWLLNTACISDFNDGWNEAEANLSTNLSDCSLALSPYRCKREARAIFEQEISSVQQSFDDCVENQG